MYVPSWNHDGLMFSSHKNLTYVDICWPSWIQIRRWSRSTTTTQRTCGSWNDFRRPRTVRADVPWARSRPLTIRPTTKGRGAWASVAPGDTSRRMRCHRHQRIRPDHPWCLGHVCYIQKTSKIWHIDIYRYDIWVLWIIWGIYVGHLLNWVFLNCQKNETYPLDPFEISTFRCENPYLKRHR